MFGPKLGVRRLARGFGRDPRECVGLEKRGPALGCRVFGRGDGESCCGAGESYLSGNIWVSML